MDGRALPRHIDVVDEQAAPVHVGDVQPVQGAVDAVADQARGAEVAVPVAVGDSVMGFSHGSERPLSEAHTPPSHTPLVQSASTKHALPSGLEVPGSQLIGASVVYAEFGRFATLRARSRCWSSASVQSRVERPIAAHLASDF